MVSNFQTTPTKSSHDSTNGQRQTRDGKTVRVVSGRGFRYVLPFPAKLHEMLDKVEQAGQSDIVSWLPQGKAFKVHQPDPFIKKIVPVYFKQRQYKSFQRQLHLYGFQRVLEGPEKGAYYHKDFIRGCRELSLQIDRKVNKTESKSSQAMSKNSKKRCLNSNSHSGSGPRLGLHDDDTAGMDGLYSACLQGDQVIMESFPKHSLDAIPPSEEGTWLSQPEGVFSDKSVEDMRLHVDKQRKFNHLSLDLSNANSQELNVHEHRSGPPADDNADINGTMSWLIQEGVSMSELFHVLDMPTPTEAPQPVQPEFKPPCSLDEETANDLISLFGTQNSRVGVMNQAFRDPTLDMGQNSVTEVTLSGVEPSLLYAPHQNMAFSNVLYRYEL